jgi:hypothetical protein
MLSRAHIGAGALLLVLLALGGCSAEEGPVHATPFHRFDVGQARFRAAFPPLERVRDEFLSLIVNAEGLEGTLELVRLTVGVDLADEEFFGTTGLDPDFGPALWDYNGSFVLCLGVKDKTRFANLADELCATSGREFRRLPTDGPELRLLGKNLAWTLEGNLAVFLYDAREQAGSRLAALLLEPRPAAFPDWDRERVQFAADLRFEAPLELSFKEEVAALGPAAGLGRVFLRYVDSCERLEGVLGLGDRLTLTLSAAGCFLPFTAGTGLPADEMAVDDTVLLGQASFDGPSFWELFPAAIRAMLQAAWKGTPAARVEGAGELADLLGRFEPKVGLAFLGLSSTAGMRDLMSGKDPLGPLFALRLQLLLRLKEGAALDDAALDKVIGALVKGIKATPLGGAPVTGREFCQETPQKKTRCFSVVRKDREFLVVTGNGEGERLLRVLKGEEKSLAGTLFSARQPGAAALTLKTRRLVKDLVNKGFPPYFLHLLSSILEVRISLRNEARGSVAECEVILR